MISITREGIENSTKLDKRKNQKFSNEILIERCGEQGGYVNSLLNKTINTRRASHSYYIPTLMHTSKSYPEGWFMLEVLFTSIIMLPEWVEYICEE